jgi:hypothetical protein
MIGCVDSSQDRKLFGCNSEKTSGISGVISNLVRSEIQYQTMECVKHIESVEQPKRQ